MKDNKIVKHKQDEQAILKENLNARKNKYYLMKIGLPFVKEECQEIWLDYVDQFCYDKTDNIIIEISIICLKKIKNNESFETIDRIFTELNIDKNIISQVNSNLILFSTKSEEFKKYWNAKHPKQKVQTNYAYYKYI